MIRFLKYLFGIRTTPREPPGRPAPDEEDSDDASDLTDWYPL